MKRPVFINLTVDRFSAGHDTFKETNFLEDFNGVLHLKTSHKYFTQIQCQMAVTKTKKCYFCVWTGYGMPFIETVEFDQPFWDEVEQIIILFYKKNVVKVMLGHKTIFYCPSRTNKKGQCIPLTKSTLTIGLGPVQVIISWTKMVYSLD